MTKRTEHLVKGEKSQYEEEQKLMKGNEHKYTGVNKQHNNTEVIQQYHSYLWSYSFLTIL